MPRQNIQNPRKDQVSPSFHLRPYHVITRRTHRRKQLFIWRIQDHGAIFKRHVLQRTHPVSFSFCRHAVLTFFANYFPQLDKSTHNCREKNTNRWIRKFLCRQEAGRSGNGTKPGERVIGGRWQGDRGVKTLHSHSHRRSAKKQLSLVPCTNVREQIMSGACG